MSALRLRTLYLLLVATIVLACTSLGYLTWQNATQLSELGDQTILHSTLLLVREKVDRVEQRIISADNAVFDLVDPTAPETVESRWQPVAKSLTPSVRAVLVVDPSGVILGSGIGGSEVEQRQLLKVFHERIVPDLELESQTPGQLKHIHRTYGGKNYLFSYRASSTSEGRRYVVLQHDTEYLVREEFPLLFAADEAKSLYNVVDENNHRVYGPSLAGAGDFLVGRRFPTTLYGWRLQVAPKQAPLLEARGKSRRLNEAGLLVISLLVIVLGVAFLLYTSAQERRLNELRSEFVANVSHELKTPLSVIRMFAEMLGSSRVVSDDKRRQYLDIICRESERLTALIDNVLDFAAIDRGRPRYSLERRDIGDVVARAVEAVRHRVEPDVAEIVVERPDVLPEVVVDDQALLLALVNLLDNALKYAEGSVVTVTLTARKKELEVRVRDRGPGIPEDDLRRVFERFYRSRRTRGTRGSGIGLSIVRHVAEAHGGRAWAENATDGGAIVALTIPVPKSPVVKAALSGGGPPETPATEAGRSGAGLDPSRATGGFDSE